MLQIFKVVKDCGQIQKYNNENNNNNDNSVIRALLETKPFWGKKA